MPPNPAVSDPVEVRLAAPQWTPQMALNGRVVLIGEPDLADEILFAHVTPGLMADGVAPLLAIDPAWETLARRSFPGAMATERLDRVLPDRRLVTADLDSPHVHDNELVVAWASLRELADARPPVTEPYLAPEPEHVMVWRGYLDRFGAGVRIGVAWESGAGGEAELASALAACGAQLINLGPEGVCDLAGLRIEAPHYLNPNNLDDVGALACALEVVIGHPGAVTYLAAACGAPTWFLAPDHWAGSSLYPAFPNVRVIGWNPGPSRANAVETLARDLAALGKA